MNGTSGEETSTKCPFCGNTTDRATSFCPKCAVSLAPRQLVDWEIERLIEAGTLVIDPLLCLRGRDGQLGPMSIDLRLDTLFKEFRIMKKEVIDLDERPAEEDLYRIIELDADANEHYVLHPGQFVLAQSLEYVALPANISGRLDGRSTYGRYGVTIHSTAGGVDNGFRGHLVYELSNNGKMPVKFRPTQRVARLTLSLTSLVKNPYRGKFQLQVRVKPPIPDITWAHHQPGPH